MVERLPDVNVSGTSRLEQQLQESIEREKLLQKSIEQLKLLRSISSERVSIGDRGSRDLYLMGLPYRLLDNGHTMVPIFGSGKTEPELIASAFREATVGSPKLVTVTENELIFFRWNGKKFEELDRQARDILER